MLDPLLQSLLQGRWVRGFERDLLGLKELVFPGEVS